MDKSSSAGISANGSPKRVLFIPVSSVEGIGEYIRSLTIAHALKEAHGDDVDIHFVLNKHTSYAHHCPFAVTLLEHTPTKECAKVCAVIREYQPDVVLFDCAGRAKQMREARRVGAQVIFISQHAKKRAKGLKLNRINCIDKHWVVQPDYCIEPMTLMERAKVRLLNLAQPVNIGPYFQLPSEEQIEQHCTEHALTKQGYVLINAGSGGHRQGGKWCADVYFQAAERISQATQLQVFVVFGANYPRPLPVPQQKNVSVVQGLDNTAFITLLKGAKVALLSAGDALLQAIALEVPCVATPISKDQPKRLALCVKANLVTRSELDEQQMSEQVLRLLHQENLAQARQRLAQESRVKVDEYVAAQFKELLFEL